MPLRGEHEWFRVSVRRHSGKYDGGGGDQRVTATTCVPGMTLLNSGWVGFKPRVSSVNPVRLLNED